MRSARAAVDSRCATTTTVRPCMSRSSAARPGARCRDRGSTSLRRARGSTDRRAPRARATPAGARPPTGASRARAPRSRARRGTPRNRSSRPERPERVVDFGVGGFGPADAHVVAETSRRTGSPPAARRRCVRATNGASRRAGRHRRRARRPRSGRRSGRSASRASTSPHRSARPARCARPPRS